MKTFKTKSELVEAYAKTATTITEGAALIFANSSAKYVPFAYNGGWFIPGFGRSTERIGVQVHEGRNLVFSPEAMK